MLSTEKLQQLRESITERNEEKFDQIIGEILPLIDNFDFHVDGCDYDPNLVKKELEVHLWDNLNDDDKHWSQNRYYSQAFDYVENKLMDTVEQHQQNLSEEEKAIYKEKLVQKQALKDIILQAYLKSI